MRRCICPVVDGVVGVAGRKGRLFSTTWHTPLRAAFGGWDEKKLSVSKVVTNALNNSGNGYNNNNNNNYSAADAAAKDNSADSTTPSGVCLIAPLINKVSPSHAN